MKKSPSFVDSPPPVRKRPRYSSIHPKPVYDEKDVWFFRRHIITQGIILCIASLFEIPLSSFTWANCLRGPKPLGEDIWVESCFVGYGGFSATGVLIILIMAGTCFLAHERRYLDEEKKPLLPPHNGFFVDPGYSQNSVQAAIDLKLRQLSVEGPDDQAETEFRSLRSKVAKLVLGIWLGFGIFCATILPLSLYLAKINTNGRIRSFCLGIVCGYMLQFGLLTLSTAIFIWIPGLALKNKQARWKEDRERWRMIPQPC